MIWAVTRAWIFIRTFFQLATSSKNSMQHGINVQRKIQYSQKLAARKLQIDTGYVTIIISQISSKQNSATLNDNPAALYT